MIKIFFQPQSVALIGATGSLGFGYGIPVFWKRHGWAGKTYLVNPRGGEIHGQNEWQKEIQKLCGKTIATVSTPEYAAKALAALYRSHLKF